MPALPALRWGADTALSTLFRPEVLVPWLGAGFGLWALSAAAVALQGGNVRRFTQGFALVFPLAWCSLVLAGNTASIAWGIEYVIFALALGLLAAISAAPSPLRAAASSELFIKTGLVLMGATILFSDVVQAGVLGLVQALGVVVVVWYVSFWLASRFRVDEELAVMLSTAVSICGVSAAIAACGAIQGDRRKLSYVTSLVLIVAVPMIILMPWIVQLTGIPDVVAGAWMGGTLDTTGSVICCRRARQRHDDEGRHCEVFAECADRRRRPGARCGGVFARTPIVISPPVPASSGSDSRNSSLASSLRRSCSRSCLLLSSSNKPAARLDRCALVCAGVRVDRS